MIKFYLEIPPKIGKKVGVQFYENILSEINLPSITLGMNVSEFRTIWDSYLVRKYKNSY